MLFTQLRFLLFFAVAFSVYWGLRRNGWRKSWLLVCSYYFYGAWDWRFLGLILLSTVIDFYAGAYVAHATRPAQRKLGVAVSLVANLGLLGFFKYYNFFIESAVVLFDAVGLPFSPHTLAIILPVGISFYTFQTLSYTLDIYRGTLEPTRSLRDFALFVAFFPQLVAGPVVRAVEFLPQLDVARRWSDVAVRSSLTLFLIGFIKKAVVSDNVALLSDQIFGDPNLYTLAERWLAMALYSVQIYCDFSGYTDMAIATAGLLGYSLTMNFNFPFFSGSVTEFWRRWHISMMSWFRDYVYIGLGGNRGSGARTYMNLVLTFFIAGMWHGASWRFAALGLGNGVFLMLERIASRKFGFDPFAKSLVRRVYMLWPAAMTFLLVRCQSSAEAWEFFKGLHGFAPPVEPGGLAVDPRWTLAVVGFGLVHWLMWRRFLHGFFRRLPDWGFAVVLGATCAAILPLLPAEYQSFVYFQF